MHFAELRQVREELTGPGGQFEVVRAQVLGRDILTFKNAPPSVREFWLSTAVWGDRPYLIYEDEVLTYTQAHAHAAAIAAWLWEQGVRPGDRVAIAMRNFPEWMTIYWACTSIGVAAAGLNAWWTAEEMEYALNDAAPKVLFADKERLARFAECGGHKDMAVVGVRLDEYPAGVTPYADVIAHGGAMPQVTVDPDSDACIFYTSGTTGFPKGAQLTHRGCVANLMNMLYSTMAQALAVERATGEAPPADPPPPVSLLTTPLFHVTANNCGAYLTTAAGGAIVLMYKWDAGAALKLIEKYKVTGVSGVPVMSREIINHPDFATTDTSSLTGLSGGGAQVPPDLVLKIDEAVKTARPTTGYGMTETCGIITSVSGDFFVAKPDSAGPWMPSFEVKVVDDDGRELPVGSVGELWVKGAPVIKGYINRPDATEQTITDGGWLHTGDVARIDEDGFIFIVARKKDLPDPRLGEEIGVAIHMKPGSASSAEAVIAHCAEHMSKHKVPRYVWFLDDPLPRNASGKFLRRELRDELGKQVVEA